MLKNICFIVLLLSFCLGGVVLAQTTSVDTARNLATKLGQSQELRKNVQLRCQILANQMALLSGKEDSRDLLNFFSDTRVMIWNNPVSPSVEQTLKSLEQQVVSLARSQGHNLDLPPVGHSPQSGARLISPERVTAGGLSSLTLQAEQFATELLQGETSAELLFLRDNLTRLRQDLADGKVASDTVRSVMGTRARFLAGDARRFPNSQFLQKLDILGEALRGSFSPETLRQSRGQQLSL